MNVYYLKIRVMADGRYADCWQFVRDGVVVDYVNDDNVPIALPKLHDTIILSSEPWFAPGIVRDPAAIVKPELFANAPPVAEPLLVPKSE